MGTILGRKAGWTAVLLVSLGAGAQTQMPPLDEALDAPARSRIIAEYARRLTAQHIDASLGKQAADELRRRLAHGAYDELRGARSFAAQVSKDADAVLHDRYTYLEFVPYDLTDEKQRPAQSSPASDNYGMRKFEQLEQNIGYLQISRFGAVDRAATEAAARFMSQAADCPALIIDLRDAGGDSEAMGALLSSYLLVDKRSYIFRDKQLHLHDQVDRGGRVVKEYWTEADVRGKHFGGDKPLYILVNDRTSGAAEAFAYDLQQYKGRAVVVGSPTVGNAEFHAEQPVSRQLLTAIAVSRAVNTITHSNWQGNGVQPDQMVAPSQALDKALALAKAAVAVKQKTPTSEP